MAIKIGPSKSGPENEWLGPPGMGRLDPAHCRFREQQNHSSIKVTVTSTQSVNVLVPEGCGRQCEKIGLEAVQ